MHQFVQRYSHRLMAAVMALCLGRGSWGEAPQTPVKDLAYAQASIEAVTARLSSETSATIIARGKTATQRVTLFTKKMPLSEVLDMIVNQKPNWLWYSPSDRPNTYEIWDQESFRSEVLPRQARQRIIMVREIPAKEAYQATQRILSPNIGWSSFDARTNKLIVNDLPSKLDEIERLLSEIDVALQMRVFKIQKADTAKMARNIGSLKSSAAPTPIMDERTRQIIVWDRPEVLRKMEEVIRILDVEAP